MNIIQSSNLPRAGGHYSQCIEYNSTLYISGQLPVELETRTIPESIEEQTELVLQHIDLILQSSGAERTDVIQCRIYITDVAFWGKVNEIYAAYFGDHKPVRCIVPVPALHYGCKIEIEAIAQVNDVIK